MVKGLFKNIKQRSLEDIKSFDYLVLWGAGFAFEATVELLDKANVKYAFDSNPSKWGKTVSGIEIRSPYEDFKKLELDKTAFMISTNGYQYEIASMLVDTWGVKKGNIFCNSNEITEKWRYRPEWIYENLDTISDVYNLLEDDESKRYYIDFLKACITRDPFFYRENPKSHQGSYDYKCDKDVFGVFSGDTIIDCGAFDGDTAKFFIQRTGGNCKVFCFEPVVENYNAMVSWIDEQSIGNVIAYNAGVGSKDGVAKVYSTEEKTTMGAVGYNRFGAKKPVISEVPVKALDDIINERVDFIKIDIEGAEMEALLGAKRTIENNKPRMLLSAYHKTTDMWEIPYLIREINSNYKIYLGHQEHAPYEPEFLYVNNEVDS